MLNVNLEMQFSVSLAFHGCIQLSLEYRRLTNIGFVCRKSRSCFRSCFEEA